MLNKDNMEAVMENFVQVTIYNKHLSITRIEELPAYTLFNLFSDIGMVSALFKVTRGLGGKSGGVELVSLNLNY